MTSDRPPLLSVVTPVYEPPVEALREAISSVREQQFDDWELVLVDDCSPSGEVRTLLRLAATEDSRIRVIERAANGGIVAASNDAISAARGEFVALLDHDDMLSVDAFATLAPILRATTDVDYVYSDEDKVDEEGNRSDAFHKPEWSPERLRHQMYTSHLSVIRTSLIRQVGGFREGFDGSQDHDLVLRVTEQARRIVHVPRVLYHWRSVPGSAAGDPEAKPYAWEAGRRAVQDHLERVDINGEAAFGPVPGTYQVKRPLDDDARVSVVIPTRGSSGMIWGEKRCFVIEAVRSLIRNCSLPRLEIVVVYDVGTPDSVLAALRGIAGDKLHLVQFDEPFNFSAKCNVGFLRSTGDYVVLLNDDVEIIEPRTIEKLIAPLREADVGAVGCRLLFEDGRLQHGGHVYSNGDWHHAMFGAGAGEYGPFSALLIGREVAGVTAACMAMRRETFEEVGGLCESLPANFNDVDLSYKVRSAGYRILWFPDVTAYHFESRTRIPVVEAWEVALVRGRWGTPGVDPYYPQPGRVDWADI